MTRDGVRLGVDLELIGAVLILTDLLIFGFWLFLTIPDTLSNA